MRYRLNQLYQACLVEKKYSVCVAVIDRLCKLDALDQPQVDVIEVNHIMNLTPVQRQERLYYLQSKGKLDLPAKEIKQLEEGKD